MSSRTFYLATALAVFYVSSNAAPYQCADKDGHRTITDKQCSDIGMAKEGTGQETEKIDMPEMLEARRKAREATLAKQKGAENEKRRISRPGQSKTESAHR